MAKRMLLLFIIFFFIGFFFKVNGDELSDLSDQLSKLTHDLQESQNATRPLQSTLDQLTKQLNAIKSELVSLDQQVIKKEQEVHKGEQILEYQKKLLDQRTFAYYKNSKNADVSLLDLFTGQNLSSSLENFFYQKTLSDKDKEAIIRIALYIKDLEDKKQQLQQEKGKLAVVKAGVDKQSTFLNGEIAKAHAYQTQLSNQIAQLSARQQQLVAAKQASLNLPHSAVTTMGGCSDDRSVDPGFSPRFAFFTFGVPNRIGLNQWGAKGRAEANQNAQTILQAYYNADYTTGYNQSIDIHVQGTNEYGQSIDQNWNIEDYLKHIYEMPTNWPMEALKAQAIAARSYALAYTNNGQNPICPSQSCQVVKQEENTDAWKQAVSATAGIVLTNGGQPIKAWFSSTHGGIVFTSSEIGWSSTAWTKHATDTDGGVSNLSDLQQKSFDKASPWFYCDWGARTEYSKTAWLKTDELADIANVILLAKADSSVINHLAQIDKPNPDGVDTWDHERVKSELRNRSINPFSSVSSVSISADIGAERTTGVSVNGDAGSQNFSGSEFKDFFNVRAPANIQIVGPLYNIEAK